ncbi:MAG: glycosyltransferase family 2 protein [Acidobacteria bacterium]|nr:glycosyltransferase family 2 protein [Acidobacteriota bacterium]
MTVSFVIPNWNRSDLLAAALASIRAQTLPPLEVLVVDNGSADDSVRIAREAGATVLQLERNCGFSFAVNRGLEAARGEMVALVNNDVELAPDWTEKLGRALERDGGWFATGKVLDHASRRRIDGAGDAVCRGGTACRLGQGLDDGPRFDQPRSTYFPSATAVLARREFFDRVGNLEEVFFAYLEDVDLGMRAALLDLAGLYVPEAVAYHHGSATLGGWNAKIVEWITRNQILLLAKFYPGRLARLWWRPILAAQALWGAMAVWHGCPLAYARGLWAGLRAGRALRRSSAGWRAHADRLAAALGASERELAGVQQAAGWNHRYWRWYFRLAPIPREAE